MTTAIAASAAAIMGIFLADSSGVVLIVPLAMLALVHYLVAVRRYGVLTPDGLFFASQLAMAIGTFKLTDHASETDQSYGRIVAMATSVYIVTSLCTFLSETKSSFSRPRYSVDVSPPSPAFKWLLVLAIFVVTLYMFSVGYSALLVGLEGELNGQPADIATLRLESYAGAKYLFPGYVNQFKNAVFPALTLVLLTWCSGKRLTVRILSWLLLMASVIGLLWTGQRGAFVSFLLVATVYMLANSGLQRSRALLFVPLAGLPLFLLSTFVLGRDESVSGGVMARLFNDNQVSGIFAYRYTSERPTQWGSEWVRGLMGVLPGNRGSTLNGEVFATAYGSTRGTMPPSLWGSLHYNFGILGVLFAASVLGFLIQRWTLRSLQRPTYNTIQLVGFAGATVSVGTWVADGPTTLLNGGLVAYLALWWWGSRQGYTEVVRGPAAQDDILVPRRAGGSERR